MGSLKILSLKVRCKQMNEDLCPYVIQTSRINLYFLAISITEIQ